MPATAELAPFIAGDRADVSGVSTAGIYVGRVLFDLGPVEAPLLEVGVPVKPSYGQFDRRRPPAAQLRGQAGVPPQVDPPAPPRRCGESEVRKSLEQ
jgi:hypothetical protein